jgi:hypothetical protein
MANEMQSYKSDVYSPDEIKRMARQLMDAAEPQSLWFGTDDTGFTRVANMIKDYKGDKTALVNELDKIIGESGDWEGLRDMIQSEFSGDDEDAMAEKFGFAKENLFSKHADEVYADPDRIHEPNFNEFGPENLRDEDNPLADPKEPEAEPYVPFPDPDERGTRPDQMTPEDIQQIRDFGGRVKDGFNDFKDGVGNVMDMLPRKQPQEGPKPGAIPELPPMTEENLMAQTRGEFDPTNRTTYIDPTTGQLMSDQLMQVPDERGAQPQMPNFEGMSDQEMVNAQAQFAQDSLAYANNPANRANALKINSELQKKAHGLNDRALNPQLDKRALTNEQRKNMSDFDVFKMESRQRQHNALANKRAKKNQSTMDSYNEMFTDPRYNEMASYYKTRNAEQANNPLNPFRGRSMESLNPQEMMKIKQGFRQHKTKEAFEAQEMRNAGNRRWNEADLEEAKKSHNAGKMAVGHADGTMTYMEPDEYDKWAQSQGKRTIAEMRRDKDTMPNQGAFPTEFNDKGVETSFDGSVHPQNVFENPFAQQAMMDQQAREDNPLAGLQTPEEQAAQSVADKHGISVDEMRKRQASGGLPEHIRAWRDMETDEVPPEILAQRAQGSQLRDAQNQVFQLEDAVGMAQKAERNQAFNAGSGASMPPQDPVPQPPQKQQAPLPAPNDWGRRGMGPPESMNYDMSELGFEPVASAEPRGERHESSWMFDQGYDMDAEMSRIGSPLNIGADFQDVSFSDDVYQPGDYVPPLPGTDAYLEEEEDEYMRSIYGY